MSISVAEDRYNHLPPSMGFYEEEWFRDTEKYGPHYTCIANRKRVCVWVILSEEPRWHLALALPTYHVASTWGAKAADDSFVMPKDPLLLFAAIHKITSEGNDETLHDL